MNPLIASAYCGGMGPPTAIAVRCVLSGSMTFSKTLVSRHGPLDALAKTRQIQRTKTTNVADIRFGPFTLDASATRLERDGREIRLRPQGLLALLALLRHAGKTVGYEQMIEEAWDGTIVSRHTVDVIIGEVRKCLGEFGTWIVNRPKLGHRIDVPKSDELVRRGWHFWNRRTRDGFNRAVECFEQAAIETPSD